MYLQPLPHLKLRSYNKLSKLMFRGKVFSPGLHVLAPVTSETIAVLTLWIEPKLGRQTGTEMAAPLIGKRRPTHFYARPTYRAGREESLIKSTFILTDSPLYTEHVSWSERKWRGCRYRPGLSPIDFTHQQGRASSKLWFPQWLKDYYPIATNPIAFSVYQG